MAIYTDFFLATDEELRRAFPGWGEPLAVPREEMRRNPFTGAARAYPSWIDPARPPSEDAPPPDLGALPRVEMKSVDTLVLAQLLVSVRGEALDAALDALCRPPLVAPASMEGALELCRLPDRLVALLASEGEARATVAAKWEACLLADFASIPNEHTRAFEVQRWTGACIEIVQNLAPLTRERGARSLYLLTTV